MRRFLLPSLLLLGATRAAGFGGQQVFTTPLTVVSSTQRRRAARH